MGSSTAVHNVLMSITNLSIDDMYALHVINKISDGSRIHLIARNNFAQATSQNYETVETPLGLLSTPENVTCYKLKTFDHSVILGMYRQLQCSLFIHVCKDVDNILDPPIAIPTKPEDAQIIPQEPAIEKLPFLSVLVVSLSYDNVPRKLRYMAKQFHFVINTGLHAQEKITDTMPDIEGITIFSRFRSPICEGMSKELARAKFGIEPDKFILYVDINAAIELCGFDVVVQAYNRLLREKPELVGKILLLINANPNNVMLNNVLAVEGFTRETVNIVPHCYMDATKNNETVLHEAIIAADVVLKPSTGCDFDPNFFLAQQYGRPVVYADIMKAKEYSFYGLKLSKTQRFFDGMAQGILYHPNVNELCDLMYSMYKSIRKRPGPSVRVLKAMKTFQEKHDTFDQQWNMLLEGII